MKLRKALAALAVGVFMAVGTAVPANAALSDCWNNTVCLFAHGSYGNPIWRQVIDEIPGCRSLVGTGWNDVTSSAANQYTSGVIMQMWQHSDCTGEVYQLSGDYTVNFAGYWWNDRVSAVQLILL